MEARIISALLSCKIPHIGDVDRYHVQFRKSKFHPWKTIKGIGCSGKLPHFFTIEDAEKTVEKINLIK